MHCFILEWDSFGQMSKYGLKWLRSDVVYPSTLANLTPIILFEEMLKFSKISSSKSTNIVKDNCEYLGIFHFLK